MADLENGTDELSAEELEKVAGGLAFDANGMPDVSGLPPKLAFTVLQNYLASGGAGGNSEAVEDLMSQYSPYLQGASSAIQAGMDTIAQVARGQ